MHKTAVLLIALVGPLSLLSAQAQSSPPHGPPPGYYNRGPPPHSHGPPQGPPPPGYGPPGSHGPPQGYGHQSSHGPPGPPSHRPAGPSKIFSWLGSKMPRIPHFTPRFPSFPKYKPNYPPGPPNYQALVLPQPSYGGKYSAGPEKVQISGPTYNSIPNVVYYSPGQDYQIPSSSSSANTVIYETHENLPTSVGVGSSPSYYSGGGSAPVQQQQASYSQPGVVFEAGQSEVSYQHVPAHKVYSPAPPQLFKATSGNMEILPSQMVSYQKETIAPQVQQYQQQYQQQQLPGVDSTTISQSSYLTPSTSYSSLKPSYSQAPYVPASQGPDYHNTGYKTQEQAGQQRIDHMPYGSMFQDTQPQVSPLFDLSSLNLDLGGGNGPVYQMAASAQQPQEQVYNVAAPETVSLDSLLSSFNQQQGQQQFQGQILEQDQAYAQVEEPQGAYSEQSSVVAVPPPNFSVTSDSDKSTSGIESGAQDMSVAESQYPGVQIRAHAGGQDGVFEVIADANAPTYEGGHPFDLKKLMSMIEPGAQFATSDVVHEDQAAAGSENHETYAPSPVQQEQVQGQVQDNSGSTYTVVQQGTDFNKFNKLKGHVTFPDEMSKKRNLTATPLLKPSKPSSSSTMQGSDFIPNSFQKPGGNTYSSSNKKDNKYPHDLRKATHDSRIRPDKPTPSDRNRLTFGPVQNQGVATAQKTNTTARPKRPSVIHPFNDVKSPLPSTSTGTENPLLNTRRFSEESPLIIYHTVKPFVSSNQKNGTVSSSSSSNGDEHPNHNYMVTPSTTNKNYPLLGVFPGLVPTVNSLFDSVSPQSFRSNRGQVRGQDDLDKSSQPGTFVDSEGDLAAADSRQVQAYAITVTPPSSLFNRPGDELTTPSTTATKRDLTSTVSPDMITGSNSKNISSSISVSLSQSPTSSLSRDKITSQRFPVYQRKPDSLMTK